MAQLQSYHVLLEAEATSRKLRVGYSQPEVVNGSINPPPSRFYPGKRCYMVTVCVNERAFHGFGPSPWIAKSSATYEAYKTLFDASKAPASVAQQRSQSPFELFEIPCASSINSYSQETPILTQWPNFSQFSGEDDSLRLYSLSSDVQSLCGDLQHQAIDQLIGNPVKTPCQTSTHPDNYVFHTWNERSSADKLLEVAKRKGLNVRFETARKGCFVTVRAAAGLHSREATSKNLKIAKCKASQELMEVIENVSPITSAVRDRVKVIMNMLWTQTPYAAFTC